MNQDVQNLLEQRYFRPGEIGWKQLVDRVVLHLAPTNGHLRSQMATAMENFELIPSSPVLMNAGTDRPMMCSCFVLPVADSIEAIMKSLTDTVMIQKYGGGVGLNFSPIRREGSIVSSTQGRASGPVSFMEFWNAAMNVIRQGGKRQGAMMGVLNVDHPDLQLFLAAKKEEGKLTNFNLSVGLTQEFFVDYLLESKKLYPCGLTAGEILTLIAEGIHANGEPGVLFLDNINANNPYPTRIVATNPCGEVPLPPYGACCLASINLNAIDRGFGFTKPQHVDIVKLKELTTLGIEMLNRVLETTWWPTDEVAEFMNNYAPIGLGVMGLADLLAKMELPYGSTEALEVVDEIFRTMQRVAERTSNGRNATVLSIAPTGSIAMIAGASYGIEPYFSLSYTKKVEAGEFHVMPQPFVNAMQREFDSDPHTSKLFVELRKTGSIQGTFPTAHPLEPVFRAANEIDPFDHLVMQATIQRHVDNSVSKTINLPADFSVSSIALLLRQAHELGIKGLTMYRQGSREVEVIQAGNCPTGECEL